jgi:hypothetical protein
VLRNDGVASWVQDKDEEESDDEFNQSGYGGSMYILSF